jgi:hypothetical protein
MSWGLEGFFVCLPYFAFSSLFLLFLWVSLYLWTDVAMLSVMASKILSPWSATVARGALEMLTNFPKALMALLIAFSNCCCLSLMDGLSYCGSASLLVLSCWQFWTIPLARENNSWLQLGLWVSFWSGFLFIVEL